MSDIVNLELGPPLEPERGTVYRTDKIAVLDTREMPWEEYPGLPGAKMKILSRFANGEPEAFLIYMKPGVQVDPSMLPFRHYHARAREISFTLQGELPHWDYRSEDENVGEGELINFVQGYFMDRRPGSIHGLEEGVTTPVGKLTFFIRSNTGTFVAEPNYHEESVDVPWPGEGEAKA